MEKKMNLLDRIDAIRANSVSEQDFEEIWGTSLDRHLEKMMDFVVKIDSQVENRMKNRNK